MATASPSSTTSRPLLSEPTKNKIGLATGVAATFYGLYGVVETFTDDQRTSLDTTKLKTSLGMAGLGLWASAHYLKRLVITGILPHVPILDKVFSFESKQVLPIQSPYSDASIQGTHESALILVGEVDAFLSTSQVPLPETSADPIVNLKVRIDLLKKFLQEKHGEAEYFKGELAKAHGEIEVLKAQCSEVATALEELCQEKKTQGNPLSPAETARKAAALLESLEALAGDMDRSIYSRASSVASSTFPSPDHSPFSTPSKNQASEGSRRRSGPPSPFDLEKGLGVRGKEERKEVKAD